MIETLNPGPGLLVKSSTVYTVECWSNFHRNGKRRKTPKLRWRDHFHNIVVTVGLNKLLDATFKSGLTTPAWYIGLKGTGTMVSGDTMASHSGWSEIVPYSDSTRQAFTPGSISAGAVDNSASKAVFNINTSSTVFGCFLVDNSTKSGTTGTLYGGGDFGSSRAVVNADTLNVTVTLTQTTA